MQAETLTPLTTPLNLDRPARILLVDDSRTIRMVLSRGFKNFDCEILQAADGREALDVAASHFPDLIILDINMPVMEGGETLMRLKADPVLAPIPVMMLTANAEKENIERFRSMGAIDYVTKNLQADEVIGRTRNIIALKPLIS